MQKICQNIKRILELKHMTQKDLAEKLNLKNSLLNNILNGYAMLPPSTLKRIISILEVSEEDILEETKTELLEKILKIVPIAQNIRELCDEKNISYKNLAENIGVNISTFYNYDISTLTAIAKSFNISIEALLLKNIEISKNIKIFRILNGLTIEQLEEISQINHKLWNSSNCNISIWTLKCIASALNISIEHLILGFSNEIELDKKNISKNLKKLLSIKNITQKTISDQTYLTTKTVYNLVNGRSFSVSSLKIIADFLNISIKDIILGNFTEMDYNKEISA